MKTWFVTGGTPGGFGMTYADAALDRGDRVAITTRRPNELAAWAERHGDRVFVVEVDVTVPEQVQHAVRAVEQRWGGIDVLVNNAGRGWLGSIEGTDDAAVRRIFELNFFAVLTVLRAALPGMRARGNGWVVMMSSVAGLRPTAGFGYYSAVKFAVEGATDVLRDELAPFGIKTLLVEPGSFRTNAYAGFANEPIDDLDVYLPQLREVHAAMVDSDGRQPGDPVRGVAAVLAAMDEPNPPHRLVLGSAGYDAALAALDERRRESRPTKPPPGVPTSHRTLTGSLACISWVTARPLVPRFEYDATQSAMPKNADRTPMGVSRLAVPGFTISIRSVPGRRTNCCS